jgi:hypothetical protein
MKHILINLIIVLLLISFISCSNKKNEESSNQYEMKKEMNMHEHQHENTNSNLIRQGVIDLASIDENKDDSLYECPMDWNVLSDHDGDCPNCGMMLKEFSITEVQNNLTKYGYEYKK